VAAEVKLFKLGSCVQGFSMQVCFNKGQASRASQAVVGRVSRDADEFLFAALQFSPGEETRVVTVMLLEPQYGTCNNEGYLSKMH
jgi:hypothetical protein